jgi:hypothetical protein
MQYNTLSIVRYSKQLENMFRELSLLHLLESTNLNHWTMHIKIITAISTPDTMLKSKGHNRKICSEECDEACTNVEL